MTEEVFRIVVTVGVFIAVLSLVIQAVAIVRLYGVGKQMQEKVEGLVAKANPIIDSTRQLVAETKPKINDMVAKVDEITEMARGQAARYNELLIEIADRARLQVDRIDNIVEDTAAKVQETTTAVQSTVLRPVREINGVVAGVRAAIAAMGTNSRRSPERATQDEEMFIG